MPKASAPPRCHAANESQSLASDTDNGYKHGAHSFRAHRHMPRKGAGKADS